MSNRTKLAATVLQQEERRLISVQVSLSEVLKKISPLGSKLFRNGEKIGLEIKQTPDGDILILIGPPESIQPRWGYLGLTGLPENDERSFMEERSDFHKRLIYLISMAFTHHAHISAPYSSLAASGKTSLLG